jgi:hypothetical protein
MRAMPVIWTLGASAARERSSLARSKPRSESLRATAFRPAEPFALAPDVANRSPIFRPEIQENLKT